MSITLIWKIIKSLPAILPLIKQLIDLFGDISDKKEKESLSDKVRKSIEKKDAKQIGNAYKKLFRAQDMIRDK